MKEIPSPMQRYRARRRAQGLRRVQLWLPDTRSAAFVEEFRLQALLIAGHEAAPSSEEARAVEALMDAQDTTGWRP